MLDTLSVGSDLLPAVGLNHFGDAVVTSMFGSRQFLPEECGATLQDVGPTPMPVYSSLEEAARAPMPRLDAGIMPEVERMARFYRANLPAWVHVVAPTPSGPFSAAMELRGSDLLLELIDRPELCAADWRWNRSTAERTLMSAANSGLYATGRETLFPGSETHPAWFCISR